ncbi:hypothetical protein AMTRI_Chr03g51020 [Amborella trichopoda]|uniref:Uncharacterized protein n=1 Tax=Amborella trichopoda TaxID=13333 RepID=U5CR10_AMBTC|nr:uncharacterized membrane protein At1g75140 [Amborella trichopoda]ERN15631.1 hypothetical protein AMTR_s00048p00191750 [Amborella trichopoda]|eukprot:XP_006854164.1 uncharacterized membrane protein At1g75140 [Amborella trichopoda]
MEFIPQTNGLFLIFLFFSVIFLSISSLYVTSSEEIPSSIDHQDQHATQLQRLETLIQSLNETISRLEISVLECSRNKAKLLKPEGNEERSLERLKTGIVVTKNKPSWSEKFEFLSAIKLEHEPTCINVLPFDDYQGFSKYVAVGDELGRVYVFLSNGDVLMEFQTLSNSSVTSMLSYMSFNKNESLLVTGHSDGSILVHRVWEAINGVPFTAEDLHFIRIAHLGTLVLAIKNDPFDALERISVLEVHQIGRMRYILGCDLRGKIKVFRENGSLYGVAMAPSRPIAFIRQRLLFLTETGSGSLDLRTMTIRTGECDGLNRSLAKTYVFDASERSKAYGFTSEGDLIHVVLLGDILNFKCMVKARRKFELGGILEVQVIKGFLLVVNEEKVFVYNASSRYHVRAGSLRPLFYAKIDEILSEFATAPSLPGGDRRPLVASNRERLLVLGLGSGYIAMYRSNLPIYKAEYDAMLWSTPVLLFILFLIGLWHFFGKKKEAFALWSSDDAFGVGGGSLGLGGRSFGDSSRPGLRELRDPIGGPSLRYKSPSQYPVSQPGYGDRGSVPYISGSTEPNFRTGGELNFRSQNLDATAFSKRRESLAQHTKEL